MARSRGLGAGERGSVAFLGNHLEFGPTPTAAIDKERWPIELFYKAIRQNLKTETFVGTSRNALLTHVWTALAAILVLEILALRSRTGWPLSTSAARLRWSLFTWRDLREWVDDPCGPPLEDPLANRPRLFLHAFGQPRQLAPRGHLNGNGRFRPFNIRIWLGWPPSEKVILDSGGPG